MDNRNKDIIEKVCKKYNIDVAGVFGSRARVDYREDSDYDIFVIGDLSLDKELELEDLLAKELNADVDLIKIDKNTDKILMKNMFNDAIVIYNYKNSYENMYNWLENFFIENSDFIHMRERDLIYD